MWSFFFGLFPLQQKKNNRVNCLCAGKQVASKQVRPTLDKGPGSNFLRTNLDWFEANWILELDSNLVPSLILGSPNQELSF
jgi:hypothetical protein